MSRSEIERIEAAAATKVKAMTRQFGRMCVEFRINFITCSINSACASA
jgi:hypothetical protein